MCAIMTISLAAFISMQPMRILTAALSVVLFHSLMFNAGYKDGIREKKMFTLKRTDSIPKYRWVKIGFAVFGITIIPTVVLLINKLFISGFDFMIAFRFISGAVYPFALLTSGNSVTEMPMYAPFVFILFYALIPVACQIGFNVALSGKLTKDNIIYKK